MHQEVKTLSSRIDTAKQLCNNVFECGEKIRTLSPLDIGMENYAEELTQYTEKRGRATRAAIQELGAINKNYETLLNNSAITASEKGFLDEKMRSVQDLSSSFAKQNTMIRRNIETHLNSLRKESVEFKQNVGVIRNYLNAPDKRTFYG
jgi:hypothetical protein